jgi:hypothetical protein
MANRRRVTLMQRSLYLVDHQCERLGVTRARLFKEVSAEFLELGEGRHLPKPDSLDAYLRGRRPIPFDSRVEGAPSWLDMCEWKFGEAYESYFHPFFALLFGPLAAPEHMRRRDQFNPRVWIEQAKRRGDREQVAELMRENARVPRRSRNRDQRIDQLADVHLSFLALPEEVRAVLMLRAGLAATWRRAWRSPADEVASSATTAGLDKLALLSGLAMEAALIGDQDRLRVSTEALRAALVTELRLPRFKRVGAWIGRAIEIRVLGLDVRRYGSAEAYAFGYAGRPAAVRYLGAIVEAGSRLVGRVR